MITGSDTVFVTGAPVAAAVRMMLDDLHRRWPDMVVAMTGADGERFLPWPAVRTNVPIGMGEILVARDTRMEERWDEVGYRLMEHEEGPFAILYRPAARPVVEIQLKGDPYGGEFGFRPYPATLVAAGLSLVTAVTPDLESAFSKKLLEGLGQALVDQAQPS
ncbi:hypothetical protein [Micromonospora sp. NPDC049204]|uniref:hypothetical protein n=1 Tax=unclassified Micromonospora TaxID=2617518 RepID=UPI0033E0555F